MSSTCSWPRVEAASTGCGPRKSPLIADVDVLIVEGLLSLESWEDWRRDCGGFDVPVTKFVYISLGLGAPIQLTSSNSRYTMEIPRDTAVPEWAYQDPELHGGFFDPDAARIEDGPYEWYFASCSMVMNPWSNL